LYHVLYVDDEPGLLEICRLFLERSGQFSVDTITSAPEALFLLDTKSYDAIISDYQMPGMNGIRFLREVRTRFGKIPFILFTGKGREEVVIQAIDSGVDAYIQKGGDPRAQFAELSLKISQIVERIRAEQALAESEERYRRIVETTEDGIAQLDKKFDIVYVNHRLAEMHGCNSEEMIGHNIASFMAAEDIPGNTPRLQERRQGKSGRYERRYITKDGKIRWMLVSATPLMDPDGTFRGSFAMCSDITERKTAEIEIARRNDELRAAYEQLTGSEEELRQNYDELAKSQSLLEESEQRYRNVVEDETEFICRFLPDGTHVFVNEAYCLYFGLKREDIIGHRFRPMIPVEDRDRIKQFFISLTPAHPVASIEHRIIMPDGVLRWQRWSDRAIFDPYGTVTEYQSVGQDITDVREAEAALEKSEARFREQYQNNPLALFTWQHRDDDDFVLIDCNKAALALTGGRAQALLKKAASDLYAACPDVISVFRHCFSDQTLTSLNIVSEHFLPGRLLHTTAAFVPPDLLMIHMDDITEQKEAEDALRESERKLAEAMDLANLATGECDLKTGILTFDSRFSTLYGTDAQHKGINQMTAQEYLLELVHPEDRHILAEEDEKTRTTADPHYVSKREYRIIRRDGSIRYIEMCVGVIQDNDGRTIGTRGVNQDITERKKAEKALRESEGWFEAIFASQQIGVMIIDPTDHRIIDVNPYICTLIGLPKDRIIGCICHTFVCPAEQGKCPITDLNQCVDNAERVLLGADGRKVPVIKSVIRLTLGEKDYLIETIHDITERKAAEEALQMAYGQITAQEEKLRGQYDNMVTLQQQTAASQLMLRQILDTVPVQVFWKDTALRYQGSNKAFVRDAGLSDPRDLIGKTDFDLAWKEQAELYRTDDRGIIATGKPKIGYEEPQTTADGTRNWLRTSKVPLRDPDGKITGVLATCENITPYKNAKDALWESEEKFRSFVENANDNLFSLSPNGCFSYVSPKFTEMLGYDSSEVIGKQAADFVHPDDFPRNREFFRQTMETGVKTSGLKYRIRHKNGTWLWHSQNGSLIRNEDGKVVAYYGIGRDITEQKKSDDALRESEEKFRSFVENANEILFSLTPEGIFTYVSPTWTELLGHDTGEVIGKQAADFVYPDDFPRNREFFREVIRTRKKKSGLEYRVRHKNDTWHWHTHSMSPVYDAQGRLVAIQGICHDITEQKKAADALRQANRQLGLLTGITRHDILNKVSVLRGYLTLVQMQFEDPALAEYLKKMESATTTIQSQIEFTRIYQDLGTQKPQWIELDTVMPRSQVPKTIVMNTDVQGVMVFADPMFEKVFSNLLDNSIRHGERVTEIRVTSCQSDGNLIIVWEDNGIGIAADEKERIFDRGHGKNTGLGLFLVKEILFLKGITITETGESGKGARFEMTVPKGGYRFNPPIKTN